MKVIQAGNLDIVVADPAELPPTIFQEVQEVRAEYYREVFTERDTIDTASVTNFVGRLTYAAWSDPSMSLTARPFQERRKPRVVVASNSTKWQIVGHAYFAENASSRLEQVLYHRLHLPYAISSRVGEHERQGKFDRSEQYVWGSEALHVGDYPGLTEAMMYLGLREYDQGLRGSWFPWSEEVELKERLTHFGYEFQEGSEHRIDGIDAFGVQGAEDTTEERWVVPRLSMVTNRIEHHAEAEPILSKIRAKLA